MTDQRPNPTDEGAVPSLDSTTGGGSTASRESSRESSRDPSSEPTGQPLDSTRWSGHPMSPSGATVGPSGTGPGEAGLETPPTAASAEREPPSEPPPAPPGLTEGGQPPALPPERGRPERRDRRRGGGPGFSILGLVLVLLGLGLLLERLAPGVDLGTLWPYGAIVLGLALVVASVRVERGSGS